jgi:hypothetical protein
MAVKIIGLDKVLKNLNKELKKLEERSQKGVTKAALFLRARSQEKVPVVTGNLKNSAFVTWPGGADNTSPSFKGPEAEDMTEQHSASVGMSRIRTKQGDQPKAEVGYSALYAVVVHENPRAGKTGGISPQGKKYTSGLTEKGNKSERIVFADSGEWKFLETPLKEHVRDIFNIIKGEAKIKK